MIRFYVYSDQIAAGPGFQSWHNDLGSAISAGKTLSKEHRDAFVMVSGEKSPRRGLTQSAGPVIDFLNGKGVERGTQRTY